MNGYQRGFAVMFLTAACGCAAGTGAESGSIEIIRDTWGIPHVFADTDAGAMYGVGYAVAEDRGFQMYYTLRTVQGRLAEVIGNAPHTRRRESAVHFDKKMRTFGFYRAAKVVAANLDAETRSLLEAYCDGVNAYFAANAGKLNPLFATRAVTPEPWTPADCIVSWWHLGQFFATDGTRDLIAWRQMTGRAPPRRGGRLRVPPLPPGMKRLGPDDLPAVVRREDVSDDWVRKVTKFAKDHGIEVKPDPRRAGGPKFSHAWVVGRRRTTTRSAVLVSDPQTPVRNPSLFHEYHARGKTFNARGIAVPGSPVILIGFTDRIAWGLTALGADQADLFRLKTDAEHPDQYFFDGQWRKMTVLRETIKVRGGRSIEYPVRVTHLGPVVTPFAFASRGEGHVALKRVPVCETDRETAQAFFAVVRARNAGEFAEALAKWRFPTANCVFGDSAGNIGYWTVGAMPVRSRHALNAGRAAHDGTESRHDWQGFVPHELLPHVMNPKRGYLGTANHRPIESFYPVSFGQMTGAGGDTIRSWRLRERLEAKRTFTPEEVLAIHHDAVNPAHREIVRLGLHLRDVQKAELADETKAALDVLGPWLKAGASSDLTVPGAALANEIGTFFRMVATPLAQVYGGGQSGLAYFLRTAGGRIDTDPRAELNDLERQFIDRSLAGAWRKARGRLGRDPALWGQRARESVAKRKLGWYVSLDGFGTLKAENDLTYPPITCVDGATIKSQAGQCYTQYVPLHDPDSARTILPVGNSERLDSPHRTDTTTMWASGRLRPAPLSREAVDKIAASRVTLTR